MLVEAIERRRLTPGDEVAMAIDAAATELYRDGAYVSPVKADRSRRGVRRISRRRCAPSYPIISIEDGMAEDDWEGWAALTRHLGASVQLVGDDLFVTDGGGWPAGSRRGSPTPS